MIMKIRILAWKAMRWLLFRLEAETAHRITVMLIRLGIRLRNVPLETISGGGVTRESDDRNADNPIVFGIPFSSRLGLAAGFDKNAEIITGLPSLGFGFAEIGTVTPRPQPGNSQPRLFRNFHEQAVFNRMGFNGLGASVVSQRLKNARNSLPSNFRVGVNVGKNKDTPNESAHKDYVQAIEPFEGLADYLVINVSSPNTPGLRALQTVDHLKLILEGVINLLLKWERKVPLLLKLAPEIPGKELQILIKSLESHGVDGWILTNTKGGVLQVGNQVLEGGWSGRLLAPLSRQSLIEARSMTQKPIVSVGGIDSVDEARSRIAEGADLLQVYTGWIFKGPVFPNELLRAIPELKH
jgi:dihydroorotate dehydrogenase